MKSIARLCHVKSSTQKVRLVTNLIKNKKVSDAIHILNYTNKKTAGIIKKILNSAISNAEHNNGLDIDNLKIFQIFVDTAKSLKRIMPRAKGRADHIIKRNSYVTIVLSDN